MIAMIDIAMAVYHYYAGKVPSIVGRIVGRFFLRPHSAVWWKMIAHRSTDVCVVFLWLADFCRRAAWYAS